MITKRRMAMLGLLLTLAACGGTPEQTAPNIDNNAPQQVENQPESTAEASVPDNVVARVNGVNITRDMYDVALNRRLKTSVGTDNASIEAQVLDALIEQMLIEQGASSLGVFVTDADVTTEIANLRQSVNSDEDWQAFLTMNGYSEDTMVEAQRQSLITQRVRDKLTEQLSGNVRQVHARHILVQTEEEANSILQKVSDGEDFAVLANQFSLDLTTKDQGGDLGWFIGSELMDARLAEVAFSLQPGQVAGPIVSRLGYHVIQTLEIADRPIEPERLPILMENMFINWLSEQLQTATIERFSVE